MPSCTPCEPHMQALKTDSCMLGAAKPKHSQPPELEQVRSGIACDAEMGPDRSGQGSRRTSRACATLRATQISAAAQLTVSRQAPDAGSCMGNPALQQLAVRPALVGGDGQVHGVRLLCDCLVYGASRHVQHVSLLCRHTPDQWTVPRGMCRTPPSSAARRRDLPESLDSQGLD